MLTPLNEFICDNCGQVIKNPTEGILEWISEFDSTHKTYIGRDFKILHHNSTSPLKKSNGRGCSVHFAERGLSDVGLEMLLNKDYGMGYLISLLDPGKIHCANYTIPLVKDIREYVELVRRLTIPHFEEARLYWTEALNDQYFSGDNEINVYTVSKLKSLIEKYAK